MELQTLYRQGSTGAAYQWRTWTEGADVVAEHGQVGGQLMIARRTAEAKNVGRSNETTPEQQAILEAKSDWQHKFDRKYVTSLDQIGNRILAVMLAPNDKWIGNVDKHGNPEPKRDTRKYAKYPGYVQPKLDGGRCLAYWDGDDIVLMTRGQKTWNIPHIVVQLKKIMPKDAMFDGELYCHGVKLQTIMKWIKKNRPETMRIGFHVYDIPMADGEEKPQFERIADLERLVPMQQKVEGTDLVPCDDTPHIFRVPTFEVSDEEQVMLCDEAFVEAGYEGTMFRNAHGLYDWGGRSKNLLKIKRFEDAEFKVVGFVQIETGAHTGCVKWICEISDGGKTFTVVPNGSLPDRRKWFKEGDKYVGQMLTVKFMGFSDDGIPKIAKGKCFRPVEDLAAA